MSFRKRARTRFIKTRKNITSNRFDRITWRNFGNNTLNLCVSPTQRWVKFSKCTKPTKIGFFRTKTLVFWFPAPSWSWFRPFLWTQPLQSWLMTLWSQISSWWTPWSRAPRPAARSFCWTSGATWVILSAWPKLNLLSTIMFMSCAAEYSQASSVFQGPVPTWAFGQPPW